MLGAARAVAAQSRHRCRCLPGRLPAHRARYRTGIAPLVPQSPAGLAGDALEDAGIRADRFDDHRRLKWSKLLLNLPANAPCAILDASTLAQVSG